MRRPGLYLHIPFCSAICPYCDFAVLRGGRRRRAEFVDGLAAEIEMWRGEGRRKIEEWYQARAGARLIEHEAAD